MQVLVVVVCGIAFVAILGVLIVGTRHRQRMTNANIQGIAESLGLLYEAKGERAFRDAWSAVPGLPKRGDVNHVIFGDYAGLPVTCFRHKYVVSTGQSTAVIVHWVFATDTPHWPAMHVHRRNWVSKALKMRSHVSEDAAFDRAWSIKAESKEFCAGMLTEPVREFLARPTTHITKRVSPKWHFVGGKACMVVRADIKPENLRGALDHLIGMWTALTPA